MVNDNSRKFKQNQMMFCIQPCIVEFSRSVDFCEDRLRERGSLPVTFYVLTRVFPMANDNSRKFKQNQICLLYTSLSMKLNSTLSYPLLLPPQNFFLVLKDSYLKIFKGRIHNKNSIEEESLFKDIYYYR